MTAQTETGPGYADAPTTPSVVDIAAQLKTAIAELNEKIKFHQSEAKRLIDVRKQIKGSLVTPRAKKKAGATAPKTDKPKK